MAAAWFQLRGAAGDVLLSFSPSGNNHGRAVAYPSGNAQDTARMPDSKVSCGSVKALGCWVLASWSSADLVVKNPPANTGDIRDVDLIPGSGRSPGEGHGNPLQDSYLENPRD